MNKWVLLILFAFFSSANISSKEKTQSFNNDNLLSKNVTNNNKNTNNNYKTYSYSKSEYTMTFNGTNDIINGDNLQISGLNILTKVIFNGNFSQILRDCTIFLSFK